MDKRNTIIVVFRVVAIFLLFNGFSNTPHTIFRLTDNTEILPSSSGFRIVMGIITILLPITFAFFLWNKSEWIADKILKPFGMDELWEDEVSEATEENSETEITVPTEEYFFTHLSREEIESLAFTIIGVWVLATALPESIGRIMMSISFEDFIPLIYPLSKTIIGLLLLFKANRLTAWFGKWRELRMKE